MAGRVTQIVKEYGEEVREVIYSCIGDSANGSIPDTEVSTEVYRQVQGMSLDSVEVVPGATAPDAADVVVNDEHGLDVLGGNGTALIHATLPKATIPTIDSQNKRIPLRGKFTVGVANQATASALYKIIMVFVRAV